MYLTEQIENLKDLSKTFFNNNKQYISTQSERFCLLVRNQINSQGFLLKKLMAGLPSNMREFFSMQRQNIKQSTFTILNVNRYTKHSELLLEINRKIIEIKQKIELHFLSKRNLLSEQNIKLSAVSSQVKRNNEIIDHLYEKITLLDPVNTLMRGYSITRLNGKAITNSSELKKGIQIETQLAEGIVISTVENKK